MRGTFALTNSISAHAFIQDFIPYKFGAIAFYKHVRHLLFKNYVLIIAIMRILQQAFILHITMSRQCSTTMDFLMLTKIIKQLHTILSTY